MSRPSSFSLRGRKALVAIKDERDATIVRRQFERLGIECVAWTPGEPVDFAPDLSLIDDEFLPLLQPAQRAFLARSPVIALLAHRDPKPPEAGVRTRPSFVPSEAVTIGRHLCRARHGIRAKRTHNRIEAADPQTRAAPAVTSRRACSRSPGDAFAFARRTCRVCADPQSRYGATQDNRRTLGGDYGKGPATARNGLDRLQLRAGVTGRNLLCPAGLVGVASSHREDEP
ncbi:hypothetical protein ACVWYI_002598 [Bradyrhizobium sp. LB13.1]